MGREFDIRREIDLPATPEQVWEAITTRRGMAGWFGDQEPIPEGLTPAAWEPPHRLRIELPVAPDGSTQAFEYVIEGRSGGRARLRFVHSGFLSHSWEGDFDFEELTGRGWDMYLQTLAEYLSQFQDRSATYITVDAPPASAEPSAWPVLLAGLGLREGVVEGHAVQVAVDGLPPIEGVVDYVSSSFLGVRTDDALYRFHGRAAIGMPIAVGHHLFAEGVDAERERDAWRSWLARVFP
jgi:uncharacterized protein YndB with AHSA1/START domain